MKPQYMLYLRFKNYTATNRFFVTIFSIKLIFISFYLTEIGNEKFARVRFICSSTTSSEDTIISDKRMVDEETSTRPVQIYLEQLYELSDSTGHVFGYSRTVQSAVRVSVTCEGRESHG